jgi:hypothetical protein
MPLIDKTPVAHMLNGCAALEKYRMSLGGQSTSQERRLPYTAGQVTINADVAGNTGEFT